MTKKITSQLLEKVFNESCWGSDLPDLVKMARLINDYFYSDPPSPDIAKLEKKEHQYGGENLSNGFDPAFGTPSPEMVCPTYPEQDKELCEQCHHAKPHAFEKNICDAHLKYCKGCVPVPLPEPPEKVEGLLGWGK